MNTFHISVIGAGENEVHPDIRSIAGSLSYEVYDTERLMQPMTPIPEVILCYTGKNEISYVEIAQLLRMNYPETSIFFIATEKKDFDKKKLIKNGFTQAYLLPWEKSDLLRAMQEESVYSQRPELRDYRPVKIVDLVAGTNLPFSMNVYMPLNNKFLPFSREGEPIVEEKLKKLHEQSFNTLFIHKNDMEKFRNYTADVFRQLLKPGKMSETERQDRLDRCVRDLISDMFIDDNRQNTFSKSTQLLEEVKEMIKLLVEHEEEDLSLKISILLNQENNFYLHLSNVSAFVGLFAIVLRFESPHLMALAGILHDIGKINLPAEFNDLEMHEMGEHALIAYKNHPQYSIDIAKLKRMVLPEPVSKAILQHHENINGTGCPKGLVGQRISKEGRLLAIADRFDDLTCSRPGNRCLSLKEALIQLCEENSKDPGQTTLDIEMLSTLRNFFFKES